VHPNLSTLDGNTLVRLFWGDDGKFPRWAAYSLGWDVVGQYLAKHRLTAAAAVRTTAAAILTEYTRP